MRGPRGCPAQRRPWKREVHSSLSNKSGTNNLPRDAAIYEWVMRDLRKRVAQLEEDELVEQTMLRGTQIGEEQLPSSNDINAILQSLMGSGSGSRQSTPAQPTIQPDLTYPWGANFGQAAHTELGGTDSTATAMEKRMARTRTLR